MSLTELNGHEPRQGWCEDRETWHAGTVSRTAAEATELSRPRSGIPGNRILLTSHERRSRDAESALCLPSLSNLLGQAMSVTQGSELGLFPGSWKSWMEEREPVLSLSHF